MHPIIIVLIVLVLIITGTYIRFKAKTSQVNKKILTDLNNKKITEREAILKLKEFYK